MSAITAKASRKMKKYAVLTREPRCFLGSFDFSWEQRKFEEIAVRSSVICSDDTLPRVEYEDIVSGAGRLNKDIYAKQSSKSGIAFHQGDVLYGKLRPYLQNWLLPTFDGLAVGDFWVLQPQNADSSFLYRLIQSRQFDEVANQSTGTKMPRADWKLVSKTVFSIPSSISEQAAIGTYFTALDSLITLHQRKCANLCSPSQVVFSLLFATSTFSWEQRKAKEICSIGTGKSNTQDQVDDGKYPFYIRSDVPVRSNKYLYDCEAVITIGDGNIGKVFHYVNGKFDLHQRCYKMTDFKDIWGKYFFYYFSTKFYDRAMKMTAKATVDSVRLEMISEMDIKKPPQISEQKQIAEFFANLDNLITLHQRECISFTGRADRLILTANKKRTTSSWEQRKLTEFVEFFSGLTYTPNDVQENGTLVLRSSNVSNGEVVDADNIYVNPQVVNSENVKVGDIVVVVRNGSRSLIGKHAQIKAFMPNTVIGAFMTGIRSECPEFTNALLNTSRFEEEIAMNMGATINQITGYMFSKMEFKVPCLDEQKKIGEYFEKLDNLITLHQRKPFLMKWRTSDANRNQTNRLVL